MKTFTVADLFRIIQEGLESGALSRDAEVVIGYDAGFATTAKDAGANRVGELYIGTD